MGADAVPINPYRLVREIRDALPRDASISVDGETIMGICRAILPSYRERSRFNAGTTGCMGTGVPYAVGAALANPDSPSVAIVGDYAFGAAVMAVETAARVGARRTTASSAPGRSSRVARWPDRSSVRRPE